MQPGTSLISPADATNILQNCQGESQQHVERSLQMVAARLLKPDTSVTEAALELLQTNPTETIPYLPDLISAHPHDVSNAVESLSDILQSDRMHLVPILATIADLPLSRDHQLQTRATLTYALSIVDDDDVPAVVRAVLRTTPRIHTAAQWSANALRKGLSRGLRADVVPVLAHVINDTLRIRTPLSRALRRCAGNPAPVWIDFIVWIYTMERSIAIEPHALSDAITSLKSCVHAGMLAGGIDFVRAEVQRAALALRDCANGIRVLVEVVLEALGSGIVEAINFATFARLVVTICPNAGPLVTRDLVRNQSQRTLARDLAALSVTRLVKPTHLEANELLSYNTIPLVHVISESKESSEIEHIWGQTFVKLRKSLLFGFHIEKTRALRVAIQICRNADAETVNELIAVMEASIDVSLSNEVAIAYLDIISIALMKGFLSNSFASSLWSKRIVKQVPNKLFRRITESDGSEVGPLTETFHCSSMSMEVLYELLHVDIASVMDQPPMALSSIVSTVCALFARLTRGQNEHEAIACIMDTNVLIPVTSLPLYKALEDPSLPFGFLVELASAPAREIKQLKTAAQQIIPPSIISSHYEHLVSAMLSFRCGMATVVGLVNLVCQKTYTFACISNLRVKNFVNEDSDKKDITWLLLERLSEFFRMRTGMYLGYEIFLHGNCEADGASQKSRNRNCVEAMSHRKRFHSKDQALHTAETVLESVQQSANGLLHVRGLTKMEEELPDFPCFSLQAIICSVLAIPDDFPECPLRTTTNTAHARDADLLQMDGLLLRKLLFYLKCNDTTIESADAHTGKTSRNIIHRKARHKKRPRYQTERTKKDNFSSGKKSTHVLEDMSQENWFLPETDDDNDEMEVTDNEDCDRTMLLWATNKIQQVSQYDLLSDSYVLPSIENSATLTEHGLSSSILLAQLGGALLDRAASYVAIARNSRAGSSSNVIMREFSAISCAALSSLSLIFRIMCCSRKDETKTNDCLQSTSATSEEIDDFRLLMESHILSRYHLEASSSKQIQPKSNGNKESKVFNTLLWISKYAVDTRVAYTCVETLLTISEFIPQHRKIARRIALNSLYTIYEYDVHETNLDNNRHITTENDYCEWVMRARRNLEVTNNINDGVQSETDLPPWTSVKTKGGRSLANLGQQRLCAYFAGTSLRLALLEGCAWTRELCSWLNGEDDEENLNTQSPVTFLRSTTPKQADEPSHSQRTNNTQNLMETIGFRNIIDVLVQLSVHGLRDFSTFSLASGNDLAIIEFTLNSYTSTSLQLFCGVVHLYLNKTKQLKEPERAKLVFDCPLDFLIMISSITINNLLRHRLDKLQTWYSDPRTDISEITEELRSDINHMLHYVVRLLDLSSQVLAHIKATYKARQATATPISSQKSTGILRERQSQRPPNFADLTRARRLAPRLSSATERVSQILAKLMKSMRIRSKKFLISLPVKVPWENDQLHFGSGLLDHVDDTKSKSVDNRQKDLQENGDSECSSLNMMYERDQGFHVPENSGNERGDDLVQTVSVNFGNR